MPITVEAGNEIIIPLFDVTWSQNLATRNADYYVVTAHNIITGIRFPFFIAAEYYNPSTQANSNHITRVGSLVPGGRRPRYSVLTGYSLRYPLKYPAEGYKLKVNNILQYGQKNVAGEGRFVVYHDKQRRPYQHRFTDAAADSAPGTVAQEVVKFFGYAPIDDPIRIMGRCSIVGDYLHTF
ncbi:hypothetical protein BJ165DRAFT_1403561 [Panaeolus papilionaceus]|nr:hypothetical protein BJ165DRAFT_1403561 [Panaeolus papilionaceus]